MRFNDAYEYTPINRHNLLNATLNSSIVNIFHLSRTLEGRDNIEENFLKRCRTITILFSNKLSIEFSGMTKRLLLVKESNKQDIKWYGIKPISTYNQINLLDKKLSQHSLKEVLGKKIQSVKVLIPSELKDSFRQGQAIEWQFQDGSYLTLGIELFNKIDFITLTQHKGEIKLNFLKNNIEFTPKLKVNHSFYDYYIDKEKCNGLPLIEPVYKIRRDNTIDYYTYESEEYVNFFYLKPQENYQQLLNLRSLIFDYQFGFLDLKFVIYRGDIKIFNIIDIVEKYILEENINFIDSLLNLLNSD